LRFVALTLIGSLGSAAVYLLVGYSLGPILVSNGQILTALITQNILYALAIVCAAYTAYYSMRKLKQKRATTNFLRKSETE
jgi:membrane protein DedA with SNARE-associated domain